MKAQELVNYYQNFKGGNSEGIIDNRMDKATKLAYDLDDISGGNYSWRVDSNANIIAPKNLSDEEASKIYDRIRRQEMSTNLLNQHLSRIK